jgi:hypothetical protein
VIGTTVQEGAVVLNGTNAACIEVRESCERLRVVHHNANSICLGMIGFSRDDERTLSSYDESGRLGKL